MRAQKRVPSVERHAFTIPEASRYAPIGVTGLYALMNDGRLPYTKIGKRRIILKENLDRLLEPAE